MSKPWIRRTSIVALWLGLATWVVAQDLKLPGQQSKLHELRSPDGKVIKAEIVGVDSQEARIRVGKRSLRVPLTKFDEKTQAYLKKWAEDNVSYSFAARGIHKKLRGSSSVHEYGYEVKLESRISTELRDVEVRYQVYNTVNEMRSGSHKIPILLSRGDVVFRTIAGSRTKNKRLWHWSGRMGSAGSIGNHLGGLWLRVYHKGKMVFEHKNLGSRVRGATWKGS